MRHKCWGLNLDSENGVMKKQSKAKAMVSNWRVPINKLAKLRICVKPGTLQKYSLEKSLPKASGLGNLTRRSWLLSFLSYEQLPMGGYWHTDDDAGIFWQLYAEPPLVYAGNGQAFG